MKEPLQNELVQHVEKSIAGRKLIRRGESVLVAVSGGLDSMVLVHLLTKLASAHKWRLKVAHFNHQLRGRSSDADERLVKASAKKLRLAFVSGRGDVKEFARARGISLEMAGRKLRHEFLADAARRKKITTIAFAHHADDQVELFFLRLLRGAGSEGLAGMRWRGRSPVDGRVRLVRPLLDVAKSELREYAKAHVVAFREDATNAQLDIRRNRIRQELIPLLEENYQPALRRVILREMETLGAEAEFVKSAGREWLRATQKNIPSTSSNTPSPRPSPPMGAREKNRELASREKFEKLPVALQREILAEQLRGLGVAGSYGLIEELREVAESWVTAAEGVVLARDLEGRVRRREKRGKLRENVEKLLELKRKTGEIRCGNVRIEWELRPDNGIFRAENAVNCEHFDAKKVGGMVVLRHWRAGDRFQPIGMRNSVKLQDLFVNQKVPRAERHERIVATTEDGTIFWVEGLRIGECFKLDSGTVRRLKWLWQRL